MTFIPTHLWLSILAKFTKALKLSKNKMTVLVVTHSLAPMNPSHLKVIVSSKGCDSK